MDIVCKHQEISRCEWKKQLSGMNAFVAVHLFQPTGFSPANCLLAIEEALIAHNGKDGDDHKDQAAFLYFGSKQKLRQDAEKDPTN